MCCENFDMYDAGTVYLFKMTKGVLNALGFASLLSHSPFYAHTLPLCSVLPQSPAQSKVLAVGKYFDDYCK